MMKSAPSAFSTRVIEDVDAMAAAIADGLEAEYVQLEAKRFSARWTIVTAPEMVLQFAREDVAVVRRIRVPTGRCALVVPLAVPESARWNARPVNGNELIVCAPRSESYACDPGGTAFAIISVPEPSAVAGLACGFVNGATSDCTVIPRGRDARELQQRLAAVFDRVESARTIDRRAVRASIDGALGACLRNALPADRQIEAALYRSRIVRRAEEFFRSHVGEPVSIAQLSSVSGVSERSLRNAFYDVHDEPEVHLRLWQLHQVGARCAPVTASTVTDVATLHGFYELGRFAGSKALFGEGRRRRAACARGTGTPDAA